MCVLGGQQGKSSIGPWRVIHQCSCYCCCSCHQALHCPGFRRAVFWGDHRLRFHCSHSPFSSSFINSLILYVVFSLVGGLGGVLLHHYLPCGFTGRVLQPNPSAYRQRVLPWMCHQLIAGPCLNIWRFTTGTWTKDPPLLRRVMWSEGLSLLMSSLCSP